MPANLVHGQEARDIWLLRRPVHRDPRARRPGGAATRPGPAARRTRPSRCRASASRSGSGRPGARGRLAHRRRDRRPRGSPAGRSALSRSRRRRARASWNGLPVRRDHDLVTGANVLIASAIAWTGSESPPSPRAFIPAARMASRDSSSRARRPRGAVLVGDPVTDRRVERGRDDEHRGRASRGRALHLGEELGARRRSRRDHEQHASPGRMVPAACFSGADLVAAGRRAPPMRTPVSSTKTTRPAHVLTSEAIAIGTEIADRAQGNEMPPPRYERVLHACRESTYRWSSCGARARLRECASSCFSAFRAAGRRESAGASFR